MKKTICALLAAALLCAAIIPTAVAGYTYADATGHWAEQEITEILDKGWMDGMTRSQFKPDTPVTRATLVTALYRMSGSPEPKDFELVPAANAAFTDLPDDAEVSRAINWAADNGIVTGYNNQFRPDDSLTRQELAAIFWRYAGWQGYDNRSSGSLSAFSDRGEVAGWAKTAVSWAIEQNLLSGMGDGTLAPEGTATRAQLAAILLRYEAAAAQLPPAPDAEIPAQPSVPTVKE